MTPEGIKFQLFLLSLKQNFENLLSENLENDEIFLFISKLYKLCYKEQNNRFLKLENRLNKI